MRFPAPEVIATWPKSNFIDPTTHGSALAVTNGVFMTLMILAVLLRFYSRISMHARLDADDLFIGIAAALSFSLGVIVINANYNYGWNRHIWDVPRSDYRGMSLSTYAAKITFISAAYCTRVSLLCFYLRLVGVTFMKYKWIIRVTLISQIVVGIALVLLQIFLCNPVDDYWNVVGKHPPRCMNEGTVNVTSAIINTVCELWTTILPFPIIMGLNMPLRQRLQVMALLSVGFIVTIVGAVRIYYVWISFTHTYDVTWYAYQLWTCGVVEVDVAVICASVPALRSFIHPFVRRIFGSGETSDPQRNATTIEGNNHSHALPVYTNHSSTKLQRSESPASSRIAILDKEQDCLNNGSNDSKDWGWKRDPETISGNIRTIEIGRELHEMKTITIRDNDNDNDNDLQSQRRLRQQQQQQQQYQGESQFLSSQQQPERSDSTIASRGPRPDNLMARRPSGIEVETSFDVRYSPPNSPRS